MMHQAPLPVYAPYPMCRPRWQLTHFLGEDGQQHYEVGCICECHGPLWDAVPLIPEADLV